MSGCHSLCVTYSTSSTVYGWVLYSLKYDSSYAKRGVPFLFSFDPELVQSALLLSQLWRVVCQSAGGGGRRLLSECSRLEEGPSGCVGVFDSSTGRVVGITLGAPSCRHTPPSPLKSSLYHFRLSWVLRSVLLLPPLRVLPSLAPAVGCWEREGRH